MVASMNAPASDWTEEEDRFLRQWLYPCGIAFCALRLRRDRGEVVRRGMALNVVRVYGRRRGKWTARDNHILQAAVRECVRLTNFRAGAVIKHMNELNAGGELELADVDEAALEMQGVGSD